MREHKIYLDYQSTTPVDSRVLEKMLPFFNENFANPASKTHSFGWKAELAVDTAREQVANLINSQSKEIIFTSGGTEANNLALKGVCEFYKGSQRNQIITSQVEHSSILNTCKYLENMGFEVVYLKPNQEGIISPEVLELALTSKTLLVSLIHSNNEIGSINPIEDLAQLTKKNGALFHTDAVQSLGRVEINLNSTPIDLMTISSHKIYGPKGVGALYFRQNPSVTYIAPQIHGGGHENNWRSGTLNVPSIIGFGEACRIYNAEGDSESQRLTQLRNEFIKRIGHIDEITINGSRENHLPNNISLTFSNISSQDLLKQLNDFAISTGSACASGSSAPSHVLKSIGKTDQEARSTIRISLGRYTKSEELHQLVEEIIKISHNDQ